MNGVQFKTRQIVAAGAEDTIEHDIVVTRDDNLPAATRRIQMTCPINLNADLTGFRLRASRQNDVLICSQVASNSQGLSCRQIDV